MISENNFQKTKNRFLFWRSIQKIRIFDYIKILSENLSIKDDSENPPPSEKDKNFDKNKIIAGFTQENDSLFDDLNNADEIVKNYNEYLNWLNKKFDKFFLCYNKEQFKAVMSEKGIKKQDNNRDRNKNKGKLQKDMKKEKILKKQKTRKFEGLGHTNKIHIDAGIIANQSPKVIDNEIEFDEEDENPVNKLENETTKIRKKIINLLMIQN